MQFHYHLRNQGAIFAGRFLLLTTKRTKATKDSGIYDSEFRDLRDLRGENCLFLFWLRLSRPELGLRCRTIHPLRTFVESTVAAPRNR